MDVYHANFRSQDKRTSSFADVVTFAAASEAGAAGIASAIETACDAQLVSLTKRIYSNMDVAYEEGSRETATAILTDTVDPPAVHKFRVRNWNPLILEQDFKKLLLGLDGVVAPIVALSAPPKLPETLVDVAVVNTAIVTKRGAI